MIMKTIWFKKAGWWYVPVHVAGILISVTAIASLVPICITTINNGNSGIDDVYKILVYATCTAFWWKWIADKTSE
jgi:hypothetical protein